MFANRFELPYLMVSDPASWAFHDLQGCDDNSSSEKECLLKNHGSDRSVSSLILHKVDKSVKDNFEKQFSDKHDAHGEILRRLGKHFDDKAMCSENFLEDLEELYGIDSGSAIGALKSP